MKNLLRRMFNAFVSARHDPEQDALRDEVFTQRSAHASALTQTIRTAVRTSPLIEMYREADLTLFPKRRS